MPLPKKRRSRQMIFEDRGCSLHREIGQRFRVHVGLMVNVYRETDLTQPHKVTTRTVLRAKRAEGFPCARTTRLDDANNSSPPKERTRRPYGSLIEANSFWTQYPPEMRCLDKQVLEQSFASSLDQGWEFKIASHHSACRTSRPMESALRTACSI